MAKLSKEFISWESRTNFPMGSWHKAQITTTLMNYVGYKFAQLDVSNNQLLQMASEATTAINQCLRMMCEHDEVFLAPETAGMIAELGMRFLRRYNAAAKMAFDMDASFWSLIPKCHSLHHVFVSLLLQSNSNRHAWHPLCFATQHDEDYVGRPEG